MADSVTRTSSFRKRPLEERRSDGTESLASKHERSHSDSDMEHEDTASSAVLDEIEQHFQRSLAQIKQQQQIAVLPPPSSTEQSHSLKPSQQYTMSKPLPSDTHKIILTENNSLSPAPAPATPTSPQPVQKQQQQQQQQQQQHQRMIAKPTVVLPAATSAVTTINPQLNIVTTSNIPTPRTQLPVTPQKTNVTPLSTFAPAPSQALPNIVSIPSSSLPRQQQQQQQQPPILVNTSQGTQVINPGTATVLQTPSGGLQLIDLSKSLAQSALVSSNVSTGGGVVAGGPQFSFTSLTAPGGQNLVQGAAQPSTPKTPQKNVGTPTLLTQQQVAAAVGGALSPATPPFVPVLDNSQLVQAGAAGSSPILILPTGAGGIPQLQAGGIPVMQPQPFILVNPADVSSLQQASLLAAAAAGGGLVGGANINPSAGGGYILVPPGTTFSSSPYVTFTGAANQSVVVTATPPVATTTTPQQLQRQTPVVTSLKPANPTIASNSAAATSQHQQAQAGSTTVTGGPPPLQRATVNPLKRARNPLDGAQGSKDDAMNMTPASVEDHFAKALGDQWSKLKTSYPFQPETAATAENAVVS